MAGPQPFLVVNADVFTDLDFGAIQIDPEALAQLVLVANPMHHPHGDFALINGRVQEQGGARWTYAGIGLYRPELFEGCSAGKFPLLPLLRRAIASRRLHGQVFEGAWSDVGSVERLAALQ